MFYTYVLQSRKDRGELYIGFTADLKKRLLEHNQGLNLSTKRYKPWNLIYFEVCLHKSDAERRENYLKTSQGRRMLRRRLKDFFYHQKQRFNKLKFH